LKKRTKISVAILIAVGLLGFGHWNFFPMAAAQAAPSPAFDSLVSALIRYEAAQTQEKKGALWKQMADQFPDFIRDVAPGDLNNVISKAFASDPEDRRVALIVKNDDYAQAPPSHASKDAEILLEALKRLGLSVQLISNVDKQSLEKGISDFAAKNKKADLALFFFTGKAVQQAYRNYLVPANAQVTQESEIPNACVSVDTVFKAFAAAECHNTIVILDGAYAPPFASDLHLKAPGLAMTEPPQAGMLGLSSAPNTLIPDLSDKKKEAETSPPTPSIFISNLIPKLFFPDVSVPEAFSMAKAITKTGTAGTQDPTFKSSLADPVSLKSGARDFSLLLKDIQKLERMSSLHSPATLMKMGREMFQKKYPELTLSSAPAGFQDIVRQALEAPCFESRRALVVGNGSYARVSLPSAEKEAKSVAEKLRTLGFSVTLFTNADSETLRKGIMDFTDSLRWDGVGLFYYAGHAFQMGGENYLMPVGVPDADPARASESGLPLSTLMNQMAAAGNQLNLFFLDTANGSPFGNVGPTEKPGLANIGSFPNMFFIAAAPPDTANPVEFAEKRLFIDQLLPLLDQENLPLSRLASTFQVKLMAGSDGRMTPWVVDQLGSSYRLDNGASTAFSFTSKERVFGNLLYSLAKYKRMEQDLKEDPLTRSAWSSIIERFPRFSQGGKTTIDTLLESALRNDPGQVGHGIAMRLGFRPTRTNDLGMTFVYVPPGSFSMGSPTDEPGRGKDETMFPATISKGYYLQATEVTQGAWKAVMGNDPATFSDCGANCPIEEVSWDAVQKFITVLNQRFKGSVYRLPTEAEWEMACRSRGAGSTWFHFGDNESLLGEYAWYKANAGSSTHPVAQKKPNERGLYDMHGNVWELCQDWDWEYPTKTTADPVGNKKATYHVARGGSWYYPMMEARCANRYYVLPDAENYNVGFRLVMNP